MRHAFEELTILKCKQPKRISVANPPYAECFFFLFVFSFFAKPREKPAWRFIRFDLVFSSEKHKHNCWLEKALWTHEGSFHLRVLLLLLSPSLSSSTVYESSSASFSFLCPSVSWSTANDSVAWRACMMFYSERWLSDVVSWVNAPSIWKILINNILSSNPSYTPTFCCALWNNDWKVHTHAQTYTYTRTHTHTHTGTCTDISQRPFVCVCVCVCFSSGAMKL